MIKLSDLDPSSPFMEQLQSREPGPVTIINTFVYEPGTKAHMIAAWKQDSDVMKAAKGFISAQLYAGEGETRVLTNIAVWESAADLLTAFLNPEFQALLPSYPEGSVSYPTLMRKVAVEGICVA